LFHACCGGLWGDLWSSQRSKDLKASAKDLRGEVRPGPETHSVANLEERVLKLERTESSLQIRRAPDLQTQRFLIPRKTTSTCMLVHKYEYERPKIKWGGRNHDLMND